MQDPISNLVPLPDFLVLEGYDFSELLSSTTLARTSRYFEPFSDTFVVVKEIHPEVYQLKGVMQRLQERLAQITEVENPNIMRLLGHGPTEVGGYYVIREYIQGFSLQGWMQTSSIDPSSALNLVITVAGAVDDWHGSGGIHGSVQASNVWIGNDSNVKLEVFSVSSLLTPNQMVHLLGLEVINTMPPEFTTETVFGPQSDIYALASIYLELLTGSKPRDTDNLKALTVKLDPRIRHVITKALSPLPSQRQASMSDFSAPLLGITAAMPISHPSPEVVEQLNLKPYNSSKKPLIAILSLVLLAAGMGLLMWKRSADINSNIPTSGPGAAMVIPSDKSTSGKNAEDDIEADKPQVMSSSQIKWDGIDGSSERVKIAFLLENTNELLPLIQFAGARNPDQDDRVSPSTTYQFEDAQGKPVNGHAELSKDDGFPVFQLKLDLSEPVPPAVRLVLGQLKGHPPLASNLVEIEENIAQHRRRNQSSQTRATVGHPLPIAPSPSPSSGDAYIFAAHFYLGSDVSLLKLQFGNAGVGTLSSSRLDFQCAFSTDESLDTLLPANADLLPSPGKDLAAGGFSSKWLAIENEFLAPQKKLWTKHTFRIDTSNPDLLEQAKFLLVKVSPRYSIVESNYLNNVIAIPLDHPDEWHSVTQDPTDDLPTNEGDPPAPRPGDQ